MLFPQKIKCPLSEIRYRGWRWVQQYNTLWRNKCPKFRQDNELRLFFCCCCCWRYLGSRRYYNAIWMIKFLWPFTKVPKVKEFYWRQVKVTRWHINSAKTKTDPRLRRIQTITGWATRKKAVQKWINNQQANGAGRYFIDCKELKKKKRKGNS